MRKLWEGRNDGRIDDAAERLNASISFDKRLYKEDIEGSIAHVRMLGKCGIVPQDQCELLVSSLQTLDEDISSGKVAIDEEAEDVHSFIEAYLTSKIGGIAKKMHTARSRNDQCVLDLRLWLDRENDGIVSLIGDLVRSIADKAEDNIGAIMPGFTHLQHAQPVLFSHWLMAYGEMFYRDLERFANLKASIRRSPIGACALAGTSFATDRFFEAEQLGMSDVIGNSMDAVSDRDFAAEFLFASSLLMMHLSRMCEEIIIFSSTQYSFLRPADEYSTGSSIMPQKKNPDMAELIRGKSGRVYGNLISLLTVLKALPLCYNKDMQEDKEAVFDTADTVRLVLNVFPNMIRTMIVNPDSMLDSARKGFMNATDMADYLAKRGMPFRDAYNVCGRIVNYASDNHKRLEDLSLDEFKGFSELFSDDVYEAIALETCVSKRSSYGGTARECVFANIERMRKRLSQLIQGK